MPHESKPVTATDLPWDDDKAVKPIERATFASAYSSPAAKRSAAATVAAMQEAIAWLKLAGIDHFTASDYQLKIGALSYYPTRGTLNYDQCQKLPVRGLAALREHLQASLGRKLPPVG